MHPIIFELVTVGGRMGLLVPRLAAVSGGMLCQC